MTSVFPIGARDGGWTDEDGSVGGLLEKPHHVVASTIGVPVSNVTSSKQDPVDRQRLWPGTRSPITEGRNTHFFSSSLG